MVRICRYRRCIRRSRSTERSSAELARAGKEVERAARPVEIYDLQIDAVELPRVTMTVTCSKGTYIRTLCHDIGAKAGMRRLYGKTDPHPRRSICDRGQPALVRGGSAGESRSDRG
ncbi:MAG: hypothetical protein ACLR8P_17760 [Clostridium fessum]